MTWALVKDGVPVGRRETPPEGDQSALAPGKPRYVPIVEDRPDYDPVSEALDGPVVTVEADRVLHTWTRRAKSAAERAEMVAAKHAEIEEQFERRWTTPIAMEVGGVQRLWHADRDAITNVMGVILAAQAQALPGTTRRQWTPHGSHTPVDVTMAEVTALGVAMAQRKDALHAIKKAKQAALAAMTDLAEIAAVDSASGWE